MTQPPNANTAKPVEATARSPLVESTSVPPTPHLFRSQKMKNFVIGVLMGIALSSGVWWSSQRPTAKNLPDLPFNRPALYKIRDRSDYLVVESKPKGVEIGVRMEYDSPAGKGHGGVALPADWTQSDDWFAFVDSELRIWLFDGASDLKVLELRDGDTVFFEPSRFAPPDELLARLPKSVVQAEWPKTNPSEQAGRGDGDKPSN